MSAELDNAAAHGSSTVVPPAIDSTSSATQVSSAASKDEPANTGNSTLHAEERVPAATNVDPALTSLEDAAHSPSKDIHNHTDDAEGESEVEAEEDDRDQLGNESEISSPPTPSPPPQAARKNAAAANASVDKDKGAAGTTSKITRVFQACEHCKKRKCRCDGVQPTCKVCARLGIQCVYAPERRMRGPSKNKKNGNWSAPTKSTPKRGRPSNAEPNPAAAASSTTNGMSSSSTGGVYNPYLPHPPQTLPPNGEAASEAQPSPPSDATPPAVQAAPAAASSAAPPAPGPPSSFPRFVSQQQSADPWANITFPPNVDKPYTFPEIVQESIYRFPTLESFNVALEQYLKSLSRKGGDKALPTQKMYDAVLAILRDEGDAEGVFDTTDEYLSSPIFRAWANKSFTLSAPDENGEEYVLHNGKPLAVREQLYNILVSCHAATRHGGRDKTCALINDHYSWVPKAFVETFVKSCPGCPRKLGKGDNAESAAGRRRGKRRNPSESPDDGDEASDELPPASASSIVPGDAHTNGSSPRKRMKVDRTPANGDDAAAMSQEMVIA